MFDNYAQFEIEKVKCRACPTGLIYDKVVPSFGQKTKPKVVLIGEAPGSEEIEKGEPFCGRSGKLLRTTINELGFTQDNTLITNTIPCRPPNNQFPKDEALITSCMARWLWEELRLLDPDYLGLIGSNAVRFVLGIQGITRHRGKWFPLPNWHRDVLCLPTFHPSYILRMENMGSPAPEQFKSDLREVAYQAGFNR
jgi:DNA polymerase